jgi:hypothetical protein
VLRHAGGAPSKVVVRWADHALELEILDDGPAHDVAEGDARPGRRIVGMRERAAMYGGRSTPIRSTTAATWSALGSRSGRVSDDPARADRRFMTRSRVLY